MSAPSTAYFKDANKAAYQQKVSVSLANILFAKMLAEYGGESGFKALFFVDFVKPCIKMTEDGSTFEIGWMAGVYLSGDNFNHHASTRISQLKLATKDASNNKTIIALLNDSGLNAKGHAAIGATGVINYHANQLKVNGDYLSAYYLDSTSLGFQFKLHTDSTWIDLEDATFLAYRTSDNRDVLIPTGLAEGDVIDIRPYITNDEGTYPGNSITITLTAPIYGHGAEYRPSDACTSGTTGTYYADNSQFSHLDDVTTTGSLTNIYLYTDPDLTTKAPNGYYAGLNPSYPDRVYQISSNGLIDSYSICTTSPPPVAKDITLTAFMDTDDSFLIEADRAAGESAFTFDVTIRGYIAPVDASGAPELGYRNFIIVLPAGDITTTVDTNLIRDYAKTYKIFINSVDPSSVTVDAQDV